MNAFDVRYVKKTKLASATLRVRRLKKSVVTQVVKRKNTRESSFAGSK